MDRQRLADALAYEQERRSRLAKVVPMPSDGQPEVAPTPSLRSNVENLSIGLGEGLTNQLEGVRALVTDPIGTAKNAYEGVKSVVRDPSILADALRYTAEQATSGPLGFGQVTGEMLGPMRGRPSPDMLELDVYHGTPHRFPATEANPLGEFDASKIGTGEGAQVYGHGIYFAENPRVAGEYQKMEANIPQSPVRIFKGQELQAGSPQYHAATLVDSMGLNKARKEVANWIATADPRMTREVEGWRQTLDTLNAASSKADFKSVAAKGSLYKADLPDEMIDRMLDWDKPLSKDTPQAVKDAFNKLAQDYPELKDKLFAAYREGKPGRHYYSLLNDYAKTGDLVKNQSFASDAMRQAGIPGIKYLDAGSRGQGGSGTRNFVVFPGEEKNVRILERK